MVAGGDGAQRARKPRILLCVPRASTRANRVNDAFYVTDGEFKISGSDENADSAGGFRPKPAGQTPCGLGLDAAFLQCGHNHLGLGLCGDRSEYDGSILIFHVEPPRPVKITGKARVLGAPFLYGTTEEFLEATRDPRRGPPGGCSSA